MTGAPRGGTHPLFDRSENIRTVYDQYAKLPFVIWFDMKILGQAWFDSPCRVRAVERLDPQPGERVLDAACGTGFNFPLLQARLQGQGELVGIDLSEGSLEVAGKLAQDEGWDNVTLAPTCLPAIPQEQGIGEPYDKIISSFALGTIPDYLETVDALVDLLKPGGTLVLLGVTLRGRGAARLLKPLVWSYFGFGGNDFRRADAIRERVEQRLGPVQVETDVYGGYYYILTARKPA